MSTQHKALVLAGHPGTSHAASEAILAQHALIVQMREAIAKNQDRPFNSDHPALAKALAAADKYLGEQG